MADVPVTKGNGDLLEMELGLAVNEDDFNKATQQLNKLQKDIDKLGSGKSFKLDFGDMKSSLDKLMQFTEKLIALVDTLSDKALDSAMIHLGGSRYALSAEEYANIKYIDYSEVAKKAGLSSDNVFNLISGIQESKANLYSSGKAVEETQFTNMVALSRHLSKLGIKGFEKYGTAEGLRQAFIDPNVRPMDILQDIYAMILEGLKYAENDPELAGLLNTTGSFFLGPLMEMAAKNADANKRSGMNVNAFASYLGLVQAKYKEYWDKQSDIFIKDIEKTGRKVQTSENVQGVVASVGGIAQDIQLWWEDVKATVTSKLFQTNFIKDTKDYFGFTDKDATTRKQADAVLNKYLGYQNGYLYNVSTESMKEDMGERLRIAYELYKDKDLSNNWKAEANVLNAFIAGRKNDTRLARLNARMRQAAFANKPKDMSDEEANALLGNAVGTENFDVAYAQGWMDLQQYNKAYSTALSLIDIDQLKKDLYLPENVKDYGTGRKDVQVSISSEPIQIEVINKTTGEVENKEVPIYTTATELQQAYNGR